MLAIQYIKMYWTKENRTPKSSIQRRDYYKPCKIDSSVLLKADEADCFMQKRMYIQTDKIYTSTDFNKLFGNSYINSKGPTEAEEYNRKRKFLLEQNSMEKDNLGLFYMNVKDVDIPGIEIVKEEDDFRIKWYSLENGYQPVRNGFNEDYYIKNKKCGGKRIKCETAFILKKGESGKIVYNYRYTSYHGQHYEQYCIFFINTEELKHNSFVKMEYDKEYIELEDLF